MNRHRRLLACAALALMGPVVGMAQSLPRQNLWVELRWVDQALSGAAVAGVRDGGVVVSTGGSVSPQGGVAISTERREQRLQTLPRLMVLNGAQASVTLNEVTPVQWVDVAVDRQQGAQDRVVVVPRQGVAERVRGFSVKPSWPGGRQPVTVEVRTMDLAPTTPAPMNSTDQRQDSTELLSTVQAPPGIWVTIARVGSVASSASRSTYSTRDAEVQRLRELQMRVDVAP